MYILYTTYISTHLSAGTLGEILDKYSHSSWWYFENPWLRQDSEQYETTEHEEQVLKDDAPLLSVLVQRQKSQTDWRT